MRVIHKYTVSDYSSLPLPLDFSVMHFDFQEGVPCIWVEVPALIEAYTFCSCRIVGTGMQVPEGLNYIGTSFEGTFVWHLYMGET